MKKHLVLFLSIVFGFLNINSSAQTIDSIVVINPIVCNGDDADIEVYITQSSPATALNYRLKTTNNGSFYFQIGIAPLPPSTTTGTVQPFPNVPEGLYIMEIVDGNVILDVDSFTILGPKKLRIGIPKFGNPLDPFVDSIRTTSNILCFGDCNGEADFYISGGTPPLQS